VKSADVVASLAGVRVLDLADESAAFATRILADLGADVVLVEPPDGCRTRRRAPFLDAESGPERGFAHLYHNANKRSVVLDRGTAIGRDRFRALVREADVLVETARPAERSAQGVDHASLRSLNPRLVHASVTPFAVGGAWQDWRATDLTACAASGLLWLCGEPGTPPWHGTASPAYTMASLAAATGILVGLTARDVGRNGALGTEEPGAGTHLEISLQEAACMAALQTATPTSWSWFGRIPRRPGLSGALQCMDGGWVALLIRPDRFQAFLAWVDEAGIESTLTLADVDWARVGAPRKDNPVSAATLALASRYGRDAFAERAADAEIVCLPILDFPSMDGHPHFTANNQFLEVEHAPLGCKLGFPRSPVDAMAGRVELRRAPLLGEHTEEVFDALGRVSAASAAAAAGLDESETERKSGADGGVQSSPRAFSALDGVVVVDFCWVLAGPIGTRILASFGADVIRVESTRHPDGMRSQLGPNGKPDADLGGLYNTANAGKRSVTVDLRTEKGRDVVRRLIARADVVTNNFRPGALERMGFGYDVLCDLKPDIILLNLPGTHKRGPWRDRPTMGNVVMAASGFNPLMGFPGSRPRGVGVAYPDFTSPFLLATTVLAALRDRARTGCGQELDLSQLSATISLLGVEWMQYRASGEQPPPGANRSPNLCPHGVFASQGDDAWCALAVDGDDEFGAFCRVIGRPSLAGDPRFVTHGARKQNEDALDEIVAAWTAARDGWELAAELQSQGIAAAPVENLRDTFERDPQLRDHYPRVFQPSAPETPIPVDREVIAFDGSHPAARRAPMLGEHNEPVLREIAGMSDDEYTALVLANVLV
jgi:crotonobetainyl-CoA:carnitine CoA-transferase CaiB-like acyl-CoA transferase